MDYYAACNFRNLAYVCMYVCYLYLLLHAAYVCMYVCMVVLYNKKIYGASMIFLYLMFRHTIQNTMTSCSKISLQNVDIATYLLHVGK